MEFKKKLENGRDIIAVISVDGKLVTLNFYVELPVEKKSIFWWKNKIVIERFSIYTKSVEIRYVNLWTKNKFEDWVNESITGFNLTMAERERNDATIKLINEE